ncbi:MAG: pyridoxamine 5'-phosphate oxidase family protein [Bellilinea sp.]
MKSPSDSSNFQTDRPKMPSAYGISQSSEGLLTWEWVSQCMAKSHNYWVHSTRTDGRPHAMPVWGVWLQDTVYFATARNSRKAQNLAANPNVSVHTESGDEAVIIEGIIEEVNDRELFDAFTAATAEKYPGMPSEADPDPENILFAVRPQVVLAWCEKDFPKSATRWRFRN